MPPPLGVPLAGRWYFLRCDARVPRSPLRRVHAVSPSAFRNTGPSGPTVAQAGCGASGLPDPFDPHKRASGLVDRPSLAESGSDLVVIGPDTGRIRSMSDQIDAMGQHRPTSTESARNRANVARRRPNSSKLGPTSVTIGPTPTPIGPNLVKVCPSPTKFDPAELSPKLMTFAQVWFSPGGIWPKWG